VKQQHQSGPTRKVIDSNALQSPRLRAYLSKSPNNLAILTDYAAMEAYKGNTLVSIFRSMETLGDFPKQVIVLKTTGVVCGLSGRQSGLQSRMIDLEQTRGFQEYCRHLRAAKLDDVSLREQLLEHGREADAQMGRILTDATVMPEAVDGITRSFTAAELRAIRTDVLFPSELVHKILESVIVIEHSLYFRHPRPAIAHSVKEVPNTFLFRTALCVFIWALDWISVGGPKNVAVERIRNDLVDVNFATYATYFDGFLSMDEKAIRIYQRAAFVLDAITRGPSGRSWPSRK
jgi:hypothetical protein